MNRRYHEVLNGILRNPAYDPGNFLLIYKHRGTPHGLKAIRVSKIAHAGREAIILQDHARIPCHRIVQIRNLHTGEVLAGEELELDEETLSSLLASRAQALEAETSQSVEKKAKTRAVPSPQPQEVTVAVRAAYPERGEYSWKEVLLPFTDVGAVEVAFVDPYLFLQKVRISDVVEPLSRLHIKATSVHMPHARLTEPDIFTRTIEKTIQIAKALRCPIIVVHPSRGHLPNADAFFAQKVDPLLEEAGVLLCWETFESRRRFLTGIEGIVAFCQGRPRHYACYDTSHLLKKSQEAVLQDIKAYAPIIKCFHLSNRGRQKYQHLPLRDPKGELDFEEILEAFKESRFSGTITLEYVKEYHGHLLKDALWVASQLVELVR